MIQTLIRIYIVPFVLLLSGCDNQEDVTAERLTGRPYESMSELTQVNAIPYVGKIVYAHQ
jgi:hypothetical protein